MIKLNYSYFIERSEGLKIQKLEAVEREIQKSRIRGLSNVKNGEKHGRKF